MAKQAEDKFTIDAFVSARRGRPPVANPKSAAQRQRDFRLRKKLGFSDPVKQARSHASDLRAMSAQLIRMSADWGEVDECFRSELQQIADAMAEMQKQMSEFVASGGTFD